MRSIKSFFIFGLFLFAFTRPAMAEIAFDQVDIEVGSGAELTILTGFLRDGEMADLAVLGVAANGTPRLKIFSFLDGAWSETLDAELDRGIAYADIANIDGRDRLLAWGENSLGWLDHETGEAHELLQVAAGFEPPTARHFLRSEISRDLNADGRDDLVAPARDGVHVLIQRSDGSFEPPTMLATTNRVFQLDFDLDERTDLVFWNGDHFEVHFQHENGNFDTEPTPFATDVALDSDDLNTLAAPHGIRERRMDHNPEGDRIGRVLHSMADMNGDGVGDLVVFSLNADNLWKMEFSYAIHFGTQKGNGIGFAAKPGAYIDDKGIISAIQVHDFDRDGQVDVMFTVMKIGVLKAAGMIMSSIFTDSVSVGLEIYRMEDDVFSDRANARRKIRTVSFGESGEKAAQWPAVLLGDLNGDGRADLLAQKGRDKLQVYLGVAGPEIFASRPETIAIATPPNENHTWLADLNGDNKRDIVMHHPSPAESQRVTLLIAR